MIDRNFGPGPWRDTVVNRDEVAASWLVRQRHEAERTGDRRLGALVARAERLIGPLPPGSGTDHGSPMTCARLRVGDEVLEIFALVARFDDAHEVTLGELRVELMYPGDDATDRYLRGSRAGAADGRGGEGPEAREQGR